MAVILLFVSCSKKDIDTGTPQTPFMQTTTQNLKPTPTTVTLSSAIGLARDFLQSKNPNIIVSVKSAETIVKNGMPYMHIINANNNAGYAMIAADSVYEPILAYDSVSNFDKTNLNPGLVLWFNKHGHELDFVRNTKTAYTDSITKANKILWVAVGKKYHTSASLATGTTEPTLKPMGIGNEFLNPTTTVTYDYSVQTVGPLCATQWDQRSPYNNYVPAGNANGYSGHCPAGCVPIAMGQIMYFWQWPNTYNWASMPVPMPASYDPTRINGYNEMARLINDIGSTSGPIFISAVNNGILPTAQFANYGNDKTTAEDSYCPYVFEVFGYAPAARTESISDQSLWGRKNGTSYSGIIADELLLNRRPCLVSGYTGTAHNFPWYISPLLALVIETPNNDGHTWVCDGCTQSTFTTTYTTTYDPTIEGIFPPTIEQWISRQGYLHMNWGWRGLDQIGGFLPNNGWYNYSINYTQASSASSDYQYFQTIVYNIYH